MRYLSPLRYPGGKARLAPYLRRLAHAQPKRPTHYAEPFAGGAGAALRLLSDNAVDYIHLNDINPGIAAFWRASLDAPDEFCQRIQNVPLTVDQWHLQRDVYLQPEGQTDINLGFATFYLNRTNRSGILTARPIGGLDQTGRWKIDARFNRKTLCDRVQAVADLRHRIYLTEEDALDFLDGIEPLGSDVFVYADPPYLVQGDGLYLHAFDAADHLALAEMLGEASFPWILTYDDDPRITDLLYAGGRCATFDISHTAHRQHVGKESVIYSRELVVPDMDITLSRAAQWKGSAQHIGMPA